MIEFGDKHGDARTVTGERQSPLHGKFLSDRRKSFRELIEAQRKAGQIPFDAGQIKALLPGLVLLKMQNVAIVAENKFSDGGVQPFLVRTLN